jgi:hypothetical protein
MVPLERTNINKVPNKNIHPGTYFLRVISRGTYIIAHFYWEPRFPAFVFKKFNFPWCFWKYLLKIRFPVKIFVREKLFPGEPRGTYFISRISTGRLFF